MNAMIINKSYEHIFIAFPKMLHVYWKENIASCSKEIRVSAAII